MYQAPQIDMAQLMMALRAMKQNQKPEAGPMDPQQRQAQEAMSLRGNPSMPATQPPVQPPTAQAPMVSGQAPGQVGMGGQIDPMALNMLLRRRGQM